MNTTTPTPLLLPISGDRVASIKWRANPLEDFSALEKRYRAIAWENIPNKYDTDEPAIRIELTGAVSLVVILCADYGKEAMMLNAEDLAKLAAAAERIAAHREYAALYDLYD